MRAYGVYTRVVAYQKSNKWAKRTSEISDTKQRVCKHRTKHFPCGITEESWITKSFSLMAFAETGTFNINDGRNANKNYLICSLQTRKAMACAVYETAPTSLEWTSTCRTALTWKNMIRGSWLDVSLFSRVGKAIRDIWLVYIGLRTKIYSAAFQRVNLSMYIIKLLYKTWCQELLNYTWVVRNSTKVKHTQIKVARQVNRCRWQLFIRNDYNLTNLVKLS